jgi:hypothetical protein
MSARRGNILKRYEGSNLLFFLVFVIALGLFVSLVFQSYRKSGEKPASAADDDNGIVSEAVSSAAESCLFYLGTKLSESNRTCRSQMDIPVTDDGLVRDLFAISGVVGVVVDQRLVVLQKSPAARWETIQPSAREVINRHLHMHQ